jgi:voltage-gated potassium channel Kch
VGYFSLVTLTTVGYGDVTPVTPLARRLAMFEGFIGQLFPAIIIGWMVSSMKRRED